jgi:hypothetical protein
VGIIIAVGYAHHVSLAKRIGSSTPVSFVPTNRCPEVLQNPQLLLALPSSYPGPMRLLGRYRWAKRTTANHPFCLLALRMQSRPGGESSGAGTAGEWRRLRSCGSLMPDSAFNLAALHPPRITRPEPTARRNASSRPACANGPTPKPTTAQPNAQPNCLNGSIATIGIDHRQYRRQTARQPSRPGRRQPLEAPELARLAARGDVHMSIVLSGVRLSVCG